MPKGKKKSAAKQNKGKQQKTFADLQGLKQAITAISRKLDAKRATTGGSRPSKVRVGPVNRSAGVSGLDPRLLHFAATVANPFKADALSTIAKGIFDPTGTSRTLARVRRVIVPLVLPGSGVAPNGVDIFIPLGTRAPPFVQWARGWDLATPQTVGPVTGYAGNDITAELDVTCNYRVVAAGVKIGYDGAAQDRGGRFYHFPTYDLNVTAVDRASVPNKFGSTYSNLKKAISTVEVPNRGDITFIIPPRMAFSQVEPTTQPAAPSAVANGGFCNCDGIRLYYNGTGGPYTFEICCVVEYYDAGDSSACTPTTNHLAGQAIVQNMQNHLTSPLSDNSHIESSGGAAGKFRQLGAIVKEASGALGYIKHFAGEAYDFGKGVGKAYKEITMAAGGARLLLA